MKEKIKGSALLTTALVGAAIMLGAGLIFALSVIDNRRSDDLQTAQQRLALDQAIDAWARYDTGVAACERGNVIRERQKDLISLTKAVNAILAAFLDTSAAFRKSAGQDAAAIESIQARNEIRRLSATLKPIPQVDCPNAIPRPTMQRPS